MVEFGSRDGLLILFQSVIVYDRRPAAFWDSLGRRGAAGAAPLDTGSWKSSLGPVRDYFFNRGRRWALTA